MQKLAFSLLIIVNMLFFQEARAQKFYIRDLFDFYNDIGSPEFYKNLEKTYNDYEGSPYLQEDFIEGTIVLNDSSAYTKIPLKYNGYSDRIEFKHENGVILELDKPERYKEVQIAEHKYVFRKLVSGKQKIEGYYELLEEGSVSLLKKQTITIKEAEPAKPYSDPKPAKFVTKPESYFILKNDNQIYEAKNEKTILELLSDKKNKLQPFIKKNKIKVKRENDLMELVAFYNNL